MNKGREFWAIRSTRDNYDLRTIKPKWEEIPLGYERIHLVEYQAYKTAIEALKAISKNKFPQGNGDVTAEGSASSLSHYAWVKLKELGEHE